MGRLVARGAFGAGKLKKGTIEAVVHRGCRACGAPGIYKHDPEGVFAKWPGIQVDTENPAGAPHYHDEPVGDKCPNCGAQRPKNASQNLGVVSRYHRNPFSQVIYSVGDYFRRLKEEARRQ